MQYFINNKPDHSLSGTLQAVPRLLTALSLALTICLGTTACESGTPAAPPEEVPVSSLGVPELQPTAPAPTVTTPIGGGAIVSGGGFLTGADTGTGVTLMTALTTIGEATHASVADSNTDLVTSGIVTGSVDNGSGPVVVMTLKPGVQNLLYTQ